MLGRKAVLLTRFKVVASAYERLRETLPTTRLISALPTEKCGTEMAPRPGSEEPATASGDVNSLQVSAEKKSSASFSGTAAKQSGFESNQVSVDGANAGQSGVDTYVSALPGSGGAVSEEVSQVVEMPSCGDTVTRNSVAAAREVRIALWALHDAAALVIQSEVRQYARRKFASRRLVEEEEVVQEGKGSDIDSIFFGELEESFAAGVFVGVGSGSAAGSAGRRTLAEGITDSASKESYVEGRGDTQSGAAILSAQKGFSESSNGIRPKTVSSSALCSTTTHSSAACSATAEMIRKVGSSSWNLSTRDPAPAVAPDSSTKEASLTKSMAAKRTESSLTPLLQPSLTALTMKTVGCNSRTASSTASSSIISTSQVGHGAETVISTPYKMIIVNTPLAKMLSETEVSSVTGHASSKGREAYCISQRWEDTEVSSVVSKMILRGVLLPSEEIKKRCDGWVGVDDEYIRSSCGGILYISPEARQ